MAIKYLLCTFSLLQDEYCSTGDPRGHESMSSDMLHITLNVLSNSYFFFFFLKDVCTVHSVLHTQQSRVLLSLPQALQHQAGRSADLEAKGTAMSLVSSLSCPLGRDTHGRSSFSL